MEINNQNNFNHCLYFLVLTTNNRKYKLKNINYLIKSKKINIEK